MADFTNFILEERYRASHRRYRLAQEELSRLLQEAYEVENYPEATADDKYWARTRVYTAQSKAADALRSIYCLPPLGYKVEVDYD